MLCSSAALFGALWLSEGFSVPLWRLLVLWALAGALWRFLALSGALWRSLGVFWFLLVSSGSFGLLAGSSSSPRFVSYLVSARFSPGDFVNGAA